MLRHLWPWLSGSSRNEAEECPSRPDPWPLQLTLGSPLTPSDGAKSREGGKPGRTGWTKSRGLVVLSGRDAARHKHIMGTTGAGKSKLLAGLCLQLLNQSVGFALVDPHGDLCDDILAALVDDGFFADERAYERLWYIDFARQDRFLPFNVLDAPYEPHQIARNVLEAWKRAWSALAAGNAVVIENLVLASVFVLVENHRPLTEMQRLLSDRQYRENLLEHCSDEQVVAFFRQRYDGLGRSATTLNESTLRRAFILTFTPALRYSLGQLTNRLRFRHLMDRGVSVLCNVSRLDPDTQRFLGAALAVGFEEAALSRADIPEMQRRPYHLVIDEFSQFSAQSETSLERVLALTRKYGLSLTLAHQTWSQVGKELAGALQNTAFIAFRLGRDDAAWAADRVGTIDLSRVKTTPQGREVFMPASEQRTEWEQQLATLPPREALLRLGETTQRFRTLSVPPARCSHEALEAVKERYARLLLTPRQHIEEAGKRASEAEGTIIGDGPEESDAPHAANVPRTPQAPIPLRSRRDQSASRRRVPLDQALDQALDR